MQCLSGSARRHRRPVPAAASAAAAAPAPATTTTTTLISPDVKSPARPQQAAAGLAGSTSCTLWTARRWLSTHSLRSSSGLRCADVRLRCTRTLHCDGGYSATPTRSGTRRRPQKRTWSATLFASPAEQWTRPRRRGGATEARRAARHGPRTCYSRRPPSASGCASRASSRRGPRPSPRPPLVPSWPRS